MFSFFLISGTPLRGRKDTCAWGGQRRRSFFRRKIPFHDEEEEQRPLLPGLQVLWDHFSRVQGLGSLTLSA